MKINEDYIFEYVGKGEDGTNVWRNSIGDKVMESLWKGECYVVNGKHSKTRVVKNFDQAIEWLEILGRINRATGVEQRS